MNPCAAWISTQEKLAIDRILKTRRGNDLLQIGELADGGLAEHGDVSRSFYVSSHGANKARTLIRAHSDSLPIQTESIDIVLLLHQLEIAKNPVAVLEEAHRVLRPNGQLIIVGFNQWSAWHLLDQALKTVSAGKIRRYLNRLLFEVTQHETRCFWPPLLWVDMLGQFLLPYTGSVFIVCATKNIPGMTPLVVNRYRSATLRNAHEMTLFF